MILTLRGLQLVESRVRQQMDDEDAVAAQGDNVPLILKALTVATGALVTAYAVRQIAGPLADWLGEKVPDIRSIGIVDRTLNILGINADEWAGTVPDTPAEEAAERSMEEPAPLSSATQDALEMPERAPLPEQAAGAPARTEPITKPAKKPAIERAQEVGGLHAGVRSIRFQSDEERASFELLKAQGERFRGGKGLTPQAKRMIEAAAKRHGVPVDWLMSMVQFESGGNPNAVSSTGAIGMGQFTGGTARRMGLTNRFDAEANIDATARLMVANMKDLERYNVKLAKEGKEQIPVDLTSVYLAHQMGAGGAKELYNAAYTGGSLSATTRKNMGLNLGVQSARSYIEANRTKMANAGRAAQNTVDVATYNDPSPPQPTSTTKVATAVPTVPPAPQPQPAAPRAPTRAAKPDSAPGRPVTVAKAPDTWFMTDDGVLVFAGE